MLKFSSGKAYQEHLKDVGKLPKGFQVGATNISFVPKEASHLGCTMDLTLIVPEKSTKTFGAMFTQNAFPGAPVRIGKSIVQNEHAKLGAICINNKISNVCARNGIEDAEQICCAVKEKLQLNADDFVLPSSTGVIGWKLPVPEMIDGIKMQNFNMQDDNIYPAARGIMTTDMYPKIRSIQIGQGRIVGIAKGAGMIEPNMATMLAFLLTDIAIPKGELRKMLQVAVKASFNCISIDSDESTSDTVVFISSEKVPYDAEEHSKLVGDELILLCQQLAQDIVRNGEGVQHVCKINVTNAPTDNIAHGIGKSVANSPLFKCAIAGNDPNVGRLIMAIGKYVGKVSPPIDISKCTIQLGTEHIFKHGEFLLNRNSEKTLSNYMKQAQLLVDSPQRDYPPHEDCIEINIDLGSKAKGSASIIGNDFTKEYISINADYRS